jgi:hypothetical protein
MAIAAFNGAVQDANGNVLTNYQVEVRDATDNSLVAVYEDFNGSVPLGNPFTATPLDGHLLFYVEDGVYHIKVSQGGDDVVHWRHVKVGIQGEKGDTGEQGEQGIQGDQGIQGEQGVAGTLDLVFMIGDGINVITNSPAVKGYLPVDFGGTITGWTLLADVSGSIVIDVWKDTYANFPPTNADSIAGSEKPTLSAVQKNQDLSLSTWTTSFSAGDVFGFEVESASTVKQVTLTLRCTKT